MVDAWLTESSLMGSDGLLTFPPLSTALQLRERKRQGKNQRKEKGENTNLVMLDQKHTEAVG